MRTVPAAAAILGMLLAAAVPALAQDPDPGLNESKLDTTAPEGDASYLDDTTGTGADAGSADDVDLAEGDLDTSVPEEDASYLDDGPGAPPSAPAPRATPAFEAPLALLALAALALAARRGRG